MSTTSIPVTETIAATPPISELLPIISKAVSTAGSVAFSAISFSYQLSKSITHGAFLPITPLISIAAYILAPIFVFVALVTDLFVLTPYSTLVNVLHSFYPVYVFCGVAFIISGIVGVTGRVMIAVVQKVVQDVGRDVEEESDFNLDEKPVVVKPERKPSTVRRKRVKIEE